MLKIKNLSFRYNKYQNWILNDFSLETKKGDIIAVTGASGRGKTTILNILSGVIPKVFKGEYKGKILFNNSDISELSLPQTAPHISLLMQEPENQLFFPTVEQELAFAPENLKLPTCEIKKRIERTLSILDIEHLRFEDTSSLSFGQKKLVAFASILTLSPDVFLLDEPAAGLSNSYINRITEIISYLSKNNKIIFIAEQYPGLLKSANKFIKLD
jgi:energy-coupling factor transport system ATP-binding protein